MFWVAAGVMTLGIAALIVRPLLRKSDSGPAADNPDIAIYRSQLKELDRDVAAGAIGEIEAKTARAEISRRLLGASEEAMTSSSVLSSRHRIAVVLVVCLVMPALSVFVYMQKGNPNYVAAPYTGSGGEAKLWAQYGSAYMQSGQFEDAESAYLQAVELSGSDAALFEKLGEAIIMADDGSISNRAVLAFKKAMELDPQRERAGYIMAEWAWQRGDRETAVRKFIDLLEATKDESFQTFLKERIEDAIEEMKDELSGNPAAQRPDPQASQGPMAGMSESQNAQINQMVERLATRLESEPDDIEGWLRLIRSYTVLQNLDKAQEALQTATFTFLTQPENLQRILGLAEELELTRGPELPEAARALESN